MAATTLFTGPVVVPVGNLDLPAAVGNVMPAGFRNFTVQVDTASMPPSNHFDYMLRWSNDGGVTWRDSNGGAVNGGTFPNRAGVLVSLHQFIVSVPQDTYPGRVVLHIRNSNGSSPITLTLSGE